MSDFDALREFLASHADPEQKPELSPAAQAVRLRDALRALETKHTFTPGMLVRQKPAARGYNMPGLAIVVEVLDPPVMVTDMKSSSTRYREQQDIIIGVLANGDQDFLLYYVDSRRFEPVCARASGAHTPQA